MPKCHMGNDYNLLAVTKQSNDYDQPAKVGCCHQWWWWWWSPLRQVWSDDYNGKRQQINSRCSLLIDLKMELRFLTRLANSLFRNCELFRWIICIVPPKKCICCCTIVTRVVVKCYLSLLYCGKWNKKEQEFFSAYNICDIEKLEFLFGAERIQH